MDKVKEKLDKMRRETEAALERADEAERRLKEVRSTRRRVNQGERETKTREGIQ